MESSCKWEKNLSKSKVQSSNSEIQNAKISPARLAAFRILQRITAEKAFSAILLPAYEENLKSDDRALCHELSLGVLRNQTFLDAHIEHFSGKEVKRLDLAVKIALRIGLYQLKFLTKIPARAAVNESVNLTYLAKKRSAAGFVNAVLRKSERDPLFDPLKNITDPLQRLAVETSHPLWLLEKWQENFGIEETAKLARVNNEAPLTAFRLTAKSSANVLTELQNEGAILSKSKIAPDAWRIAGGTQKLREFVAAGEIYLQDEASQLVAHAASLSISGNKRFLDVCAAPGSKTTQIANSKFQIPNKSAGDLTQNLKSETENLYVAGDFTAPRIRILRETIAKYAPNRAEIVRYDATQSLPFASESFDCILVDAPCSGTGTIRHNPEIRWHLVKTDVAFLADKQLQILTNAAALVKAGGHLVYSTCSLEPEEGEKVIGQFLSQNADFEFVKLQLLERFANGQISARTFPQRDDIDGFFVTVIKRKDKF
jgi:16S rRNA (cytosine967-C5)-methyltransferase